MAQTPPVVGMAVALARIAAFIPSRGVAAQNLQIAERQRQVRVTRLDGVHPAPLRKYTLTTPFSDRFRSVSGLFSP
jgi:hypothetical protein